MAVVASITSVAKNTCNFASTTDSTTLRVLWSWIDMDLCHSWCQDTSDPGHFGPKTFRH